MRLTINNIAFARRREKDGITYGWFIAMKTHKVCDSRDYSIHENGKTVVKPYPLEDLPSTVQNFIKSHTEYLVLDEENGFKHYIIK